MTKPDKLKWICQLFWLKTTQKSQNNYWHNFLSGLHELHFSREKRTQNGHLSVPWDNWPRCGYKWGNPKVKPCGCPLTCDQFKFGRPIQNLNWSIWIVLGSAQWAPSAESDFKIQSSPIWSRAQRVQHVRPDSEKNRCQLWIWISFVGRSQDQEGPWCPPWEGHHGRDQREDLSPTGLTCAEHDGHLQQIRSSDGVQLICVTWVTDWGPASYMDSA